MSDTSKSSIEQLRIYQLARQLEETMPEVLQKLPKEQFYPLGNGLWRSCVAVAHYIAESHRLYSYQAKLESLHAARNAAEETIKLLEQYESEGFGATKELVEQYTGVIKQSWGLIKYLKNRQLEKQVEQKGQAVDQLVAARA